MQILSFSFTYSLTGVFEKNLFLFTRFLYKYFLDGFFRVQSHIFKQNEQCTSCTNVPNSPETFACGRQILFKTLHRQKGNLLFMNHDHL